MTSTTRSLDLTDEVLNAHVSRRGLLRTAVGAGVALPALSAPLGAMARQEGAEPGGVATIVVAANPASWDLTKSTWITWQAVHFLYNRLLTFDAAEELQPGLAVAWEVSDDGLEYRLTLRDGVTFHDGTPFNAETVKFNIQRHIDMPDSAFYATYEAVDRVEVVDELTAKIVLREVRPDFAYTGLAQWGAIQLSPTAFAELGDRFGEQPVGTGPFRFDSYEPGSAIKYVRNDAYWNGAPLLDGIEVRVIPEPSVQLIELEAKTVDTAQVQPKDVEVLTAQGLTIEQKVTPGAVFISLNVSGAPTSELAVRKAIALAIDRDTIIESILFGYAEKSRGGVTSDSVFYNDDVLMVEYDPEEAAAILDEAGWVAGEGGIRQRDGQPLFVNILSSDFNNWGLYNQIIQEQLKTVGIDSEISSLEWNAYLDQWRENQGGWNVTYHSQGSIVAAVSPIQASWVPDAYWTITQIDDSSDPALATLRETLQALGDEFEVTLDADRRQTIAKEAQMLFQENQLTVWLWHAATITAIQPRLKGYHLSHAGRVVELDKAWIE
ncbi:MAG: ABC transporter substrate-binding protein [Thermomicrobiales bacterium]